MGYLLHVQKACCNSQEHWKKVLFAGLNLSYLYHFFCKAMGKNHSKDTSMLVKNCQSCYSTNLLFVISNTARSPPWARVLAATSLACPKWPRTTIKQLTYSSTHCLINPLALETQYKYFTHLSSIGCWIYSIQWGYGIKDRNRISPTIWMLAWWTSRSMKSLV